MRILIAGRQRRMRGHTADASGKRLSEGVSTMFRALLKSEVHRVSVTTCELCDEGACAIDENILDAAGIVENERVHIWNISNGDRFVTCAAKEQRGTGMISLSGSAARRAEVGDRIIIAAVAVLDKHRETGFKPDVIFVHAVGRQASSRGIASVQAG